MHDMEKYLKSTTFIDFDDESVRDRAVALARDLDTDRDKAVAFYYFVRDGIRHDPYAPTYEMEAYRASTTLARGTGNCEHKSVLLATLCRVSGIPARLGYVDVRDYRLSEKFRRMLGGNNWLPQHGYVEIYIDGEWFHACPAYDLDTCRKHGFVPVEFDGTCDVKDPPFNVEGNPHIEHVRDHGCFADLPWDWMFEYRRKWVDGMGTDWKEFMQTWNPESTIED